MKKIYLTFISVLWFTGSTLAQRTCGNKLKTYLKSGKMTLTVPPDNADRKACTGCCTGVTEESEENLRGGNVFIYVFSQNKTGRYQKNHPLQPFPSLSCQLNKEC